MLHTEVYILCRDSFIMDKLPLEIVNYLCTYLSPKDIKATLSAKTIRTSGVKLDLVKRKYKKNELKVRKLDIQCNMLDITFGECTTEWELGSRMLPHLNFEEQETLLDMLDKIVVKMRSINSTLYTLKNKEIKYHRKNRRIIMWLSRKRKFPDWV